MGPSTSFMQRLAELHSRPPVQPLGFGQLFCISKGMKRASASFTLMTTVALVSGCGTPAFQVHTTAQTQTSPGTFTIPPKVDIILVEDDSGSRSEIQQALAQQVPSFLSQLESRDWDYHFTSIPLTQYRAVNEATASKHDGNWASEWRPPFPGAPQFHVGTLASGLFRRPGEYSGFLGAQSARNELNGQEAAFENMSRILTDPTLRSQSFLRTDAMTMILVVGNGNDNSKVNICRREDGYSGPCEDLGFRPCTSMDQALGPINYGDANSSAPQCGSQALSFNHYKAKFETIKPDSRSLRFHAAVAGRVSSNCLGGPSTIGTRYQQMAQAFGGRSLDLCSTPISQILTEVSSELQSVKLQMRKKYLFLERDANPSTIKVRVTRASGPNAGQVRELPRETNGTVNWVYKGYVDQVATVVYPLPLNQASGYAIELSDSALLVGDDTAEVEYLPAGMQNAQASR